jgi:hypothetical protein
MRSRIASVAVLLIFLSSIAATADGDLELEGTNVVSAIGQAKYSFGCGDSPCLLLEYQNDLGTNVTGIAYGVIHDAAGQMVYFQTSYFGIAAWGNQTAVIPVPDSPSLFPLGEYHAMIFVTSPAGVAISETTVIAYQITGY